MAFRKFCEPRFCSHPRAQASPKKVKTGTDAPCSACLSRKSGGEHVRTPDASRVSQTPGSREAAGSRFIGVGLRVALAPLWERQILRAPQTLGNFSWCDARPHPCPLPQGEGNALCVSGNLGVCRASAAGRDLHEDGERFSLSSGEKAGMREDVDTNWVGQTRWGKAAVNTPALQTLRAFRRRPAVAKRLECAWL